MNTNIELILEPTFTIIHNKDLGVAHIEPVKRKRIEVQKQNEVNLNKL